MALIIGNSNYTSYAIPAPTTDAKALADVCRRLGFQVQLGTDLDNASMFSELDRFAGSIRKGDIALFFFGGHGAEIEGIEYLVGIDNDPVDEVLFRHRNLSLNRVIQTLDKAQAWLKILVVDSCRVQSFKGTSRALPASAGDGKGTIILFSTSPYMVAWSGYIGEDGEKHGYFTHSLIEAMAKPGASILEVFQEAAVRTYIVTDGRQQPWLVTNMVGGDFCFAPAKGNGVSDLFVGDSNKAALRITADEPGADVFLDDTPLGRIETVGTATFRSISPGRHYVSVIKPGCHSDTKQEQADFEPGGTTEISTHLRVLESNVEEILDGALQFIGGEQALRTIDSYISQGKLTLHEIGSTAPYRTFWKRPQKMRVEFSVGGVSIVQWTDGRNNWQKIASQEAQPIAGDEAGNLLHMAAIEGPYLDRKERGLIYSHVKDKKLEHKGTQEVAVVYDNGLGIHCFFSDNDHRLVKEFRYIKVPGGQLKIVTTFDDYRRVGNVTVAHKVGIFQEYRDPRRPDETTLKPLADLVIESIEFNAAVPDAQFAAPK